MGVTDKMLIGKWPLLCIIISNIAYRLHSMITVHMDTKGVKKIRLMTVFGYNGKGYQRTSYT